MREATSVANHTVDKCTSNVRTDVRVNGGIVVGLMNDVLTRFDESDCKLQMI